MSAIYIRMPRCGSASIVNFCKKNNIQFYGGRDMGFWAGICTPSGCRVDTPLKQNASDRLYECVSSHVGADVYEKSFIFSSVRNPYSRAVSIFKHTSWKPIKTFKDFCHAIKSNKYPSPCAKWHSSTVTEHIFDEHDLKVDFVIKLENLQEDFNIVCDKTGTPRQELPHKNKSNHKHYAEYYDNETRQIIAEKYAKDIEYLGYKFGDGR